jgi:serine/threonine-protein kinase RsbW
VESVSLKIPASPAYLQAIRLIASGLASRIAFTIDDIEDLKIAVDELSAYLMGAQGRVGTLEISFEVHPDKLCIAGVAHLEPGQKVRTELTEFSRMILSTVVDSASLDQSDGVPRFELVKSKLA